MVVGIRIFWDFRTAFGQSFHPHAKSVLKILIRKVIHILHQKSCGKPNATTSYHLRMVNISPIFHDIKFGQFLALGAGGTRMMFGKEVKVKPQPAKTVVKAFPVKVLKDSI